MCANTERKSSMELLRIEHLSAGIEDKELLHSFLLTVGTGETHVLMDPSGSEALQHHRSVVGLDDSHGHNQSAAGILRPECPRNRNV